MKLKPYYLGLVLLILLGLTASSAFGVGVAGTVTGGNFPACVDPANTNTSTVKIAGKQVAPGGLVRVPTGSTCLSSETTLNLNSYVKTILVSPGPDTVVNGNNLRNAVSNAPAGTLVKVEPGTSDLVTTSLRMKQGVDLEGSGERLTILTSQIGNINLPPFSTVVLANNSELRFLNIDNTGNSNYNVAVSGWGLNKTAKLTNVTITVNGSGIGIYNSYSTGNYTASSPTIQNSTISVTGGGYGIYNDTSSSPTIINSTITIIGSGRSYGIYNETSSSPTIQNSAITATGGSDSYGIYNNFTSASSIRNSTIIANGSSRSYGIFSQTSSIIIQNTTITGSGPDSSVSIFNYYSPIKVSNSQLVGIVVGGGLNGVGFTCVGNYDANFAALGTKCT